jgi:hypothetical protein
MSDQRGEPIGCMPYACEPMPIGNSIIRGVSRCSLDRLLLMAIENGASTARHCRS